MKTESDKTRYKQINLYFIRCSLDKIRPLNATRWQADKEEQKVQSSRIRFSFWKQPI